MTKVVTQTGKLRHILLWSIAALYLLFSPALYYHLFPQEGKPIEVRKQQPEETGGIRYGVDDCKYWSKGRASHTEGETYALWGWAFPNMGLDVSEANFERFIVIYDPANAYIFPMQAYQRPDVQEAFKDLGVTDLASSGFYAVISRNALEVGEYGIGILFKHKQEDISHYIQTDKILVRSPNHLFLESRSK